METDICGPQEFSENVEGHRILVCPDQCQTESPGCQDGGRD